LDFNHTGVTDLSPVKGLPLTALWCNDTPVSDLSPLRGMELDSVSFTPRNITQGIDAIRQMKSLRALLLAWGDPRIPPVEFWRRYDAGDFK
jgi:internalin A